MEEQSKTEGVSRLNVETSNNPNDGRCEFIVSKDARDHGHVWLFEDDTAEVMASQIQAELGLIQPFNVITEDSLAGHDAFDIVDADTGKVWVTVVEAH